MMYNNPNIKTRSHKHAGTWYSDDAAELRKNLESWLQIVPDSKRTMATKAIISPHAGYSYSGHCAAYAYKQLEHHPTAERIFILGPSHHAYFAKCALTDCKSYQTPFGDLEIDSDVYSRLAKTGLFDTVDCSTDEAEHSIEMQLPYICHMFRDRKIKIVPIMVGSLKNGTNEQLYGDVFAEYLLDPSNVFVISSDFCHWGKRFGFDVYKDTGSKIHENIASLDRQAIQHIENMDPGGFQHYLSVEKNTICGRHPITILLFALKTLNARYPGRFRADLLHYSQSNKCRKASDSSVSYAALAVQDSSSTANG